MTKEQRLARKLTRETKCQYAVALRLVQGYAPSDEDNDAINEMIASGWTRRGAEEEVKHTSIYDALCEMKKKEK